MFFGYLNVWFLQSSFRSLSVESCGLSVPSQWSLRMVIWYPLVNPSMNTLMEPWGTFFLDRSVLPSCFLARFCIPIVVLVSRWNLPSFWFTYVLGSHCYFLFQDSCWLHNVFSFSPLFWWEQGVLGIKVKIMLDWDPKGKVGPIHTIAWCGHHSYSQGRRVRSHSSGNTLGDSSRHKTRVGCFCTTFILTFLFYFQSLRILRYFEVAFLSGFSYLSAVRRFFFN